MSQIHFYYGVMGSGKSNHLIGNAFSLKNLSKMNVVVIKPAFDSRFAKDKVVSRNGEEIAALALPYLNDYMPAKKTDYLFVDEVQFFSPADIDRLVSIAEARPKIKIICYGLMVDSNEKLFPATQRLIEIGAALHNIPTACHMPRCGRPATHHLRLDANGYVVRAGKQFVLGNADSSNYISVCRHHFNEMYLDFTSKKVK